MRYVELKYQEEYDPLLHEFICINPSMDPSFGYFRVYSKTRPRLGMIRKIKGAVWQVWGKSTVSGITTAKLEPYC